MKTILTTLLISLGSIVFAQDTMKITRWETIGQQPCVNDTATWIYGTILPVNDSMSIQYRKSGKGIIQRRDIWHKKKEN